MGKKRVHELAKDYGLDNREVVQRLQAAGMSVKTHSSSVYEDEARAILDKFVEKPKAVKKRPGMTIVRKRQTPPEPSAPTAAPAPSTPKVVAEPPTEPSAPSPPAAASEPPALARPARPAEATPSPSPGRVETPKSSAPSRRPVETPREEVRRPPSRMRRDGDRPGSSEVRSRTPGPRDVTEPKPDTKKPEPPRRPGAARVVRMIDRDKLLERVPSSRLGGGPARGGGPRGGGGDAGGQKFGQVTELRVVQDPYGRGREMITVGKDKKGKGAGAGAKKKSRSPTKREMMEMRERAMHPARLRRKKGVKRSGKKTPVTQPKASKRVVKMKETIAVSELAHELQTKAGEIIGRLMKLGMMVSLNESIDFDTAQLIASEYDYTVESIAFVEEDILQAPEVEDESRMEPRPPVVTVMGHVDHGKTSLLDAIRKARVAAGEAGGITQHIGAYSVDTPNGRVTFIDTPGHAAFTEMRARGAQVTDLVILVVAADDGVMPQTEEAVRHAQAARVPIIVAVNKIDKPEANADRVTQELSALNLMPEAWGGDTLYVHTSATKGTGIPELLESILLQAEVLELKADYDANAVGRVIEAQLDKGRGPVATVLVQHGKLKRGDDVVVGEYVGRIRAMTDDQGQRVKEAGPSTAVEVIGLEGVPDAGDMLNKVVSAEQAREVADHRAEQRKQREQSQGNKLSLDEIMKRMTGNTALELKVVLKADVHGSMEAVRASLEKLSTEEVKVNVIYAGVGAVKESDIMLASASDGLVLGFGVRPDPKARDVANREGVEIRTYNIIYEMVDDVKKAMEGLLEPESRETVVGRAEVRELFRVTKVGTIAGCRVVEGKAQRAAKVRVLRDSAQVYEGRVSSLRHFKDDVREVDSGYECGVGVENFNDVKVGDVLEFFRIEEVARTLDSPGSAKPSPGGVEAHP